MLAELILCEVGDWVDLEARRFAFRVTVDLLVVCLVVVIPGIQIVGAVEKSRVGRWKRGKKWAVVGSVAGAWGWVFWNIGDVAPRIGGGERTLREECVARVGIVGISVSTTTNTV